VTRDEARAIARDAYIYGFPLVDNYRVEYAYFIDRSNREFKAPWNQISNVSRVFTPADTTIQAPNSDTPYSALGADLRAEPLVISVPEIEKNRYYSIQFVDAYTFDFAYVGSRTTGNGAGNYLLAGPDWKGETPPGINGVIRSETEFDFLIYRTQLFNPDDIENVKRIQTGYKVQPLSQFLGKPAPAAAPAIDWPRPLTPAEQRTSLGFFKLLNFVLQFCPTHPSEKELMKRFAKIGVVAGKKFDTDTLSPDMRKAIEDGMADAWKVYDGLNKRVAEGKITSGDMVGTRAYLKNNYGYRMVTAVNGIYGNSKDEAVYPTYQVDANGQKLDGAAYKYSLHFSAGQFPPVNAFWSVTIYHGANSSLYANQLNRYLVNSPMMPSLKKDAGGGVTLYIQHESPGAEKEANWLPIPDGPFWAAMRLYWPKPEAVSGKWKAPPMRTAEVTQGQAPSDKPVIVTVDNYNRAESDVSFAATVKMGGFGKFAHVREPMSIDKQAVIRPNRDTLYSLAVFDLDAGPVTITLPDAGKRFMSMQIIDEDQYSPAVYYGAGSHTLTRKGIGTRYVHVAVRTLADPSDPKDVERVHALQDAIKVRQKEAGKFEVPNWDDASRLKVRQALLSLATGMDSKGMFGPRNEVDPIHHLIGSAVGWGGNPPSAALYVVVTPAKNDGATVYKLKVKDVPVDGFWSISVYNADGYFQKNDLDAYSLNNITAKKSADGSVVVQFGGCDGKIPNCLPTPKDWNYTIRLYRPRAEILNGKWKFPEAQPVE
jgi:hypothetical protein